MIECENCILENATCFCEVDCLALEDALREHDKQIREDAIEEFQEWLKTQIVGIDNQSKEILVVNGDRWELAIDEYKEKLKEQKND